MTKLKDWISHHPTKALVLFAFAVLAGVVMCESFVLGLCVLVLTYGVFVLVFYYDTLRLLSIMLALSLVPCARAQDFKPAAPFFLGGLVILVGVGLGFVSCRAIKACRKVAASKTNLPPDELQFQVAGVGEVGAAFFWPETDPCYAERLAPVAPTVFALTIAVESVSNATVTATASTGFEFVQSWESFQEELARHGLAATTGHTNFSSFERNLQPCSAEQVPIAFNFATRTATIGRGGVLVAVERSANLREWETVLRVEVEPGGLPLLVEDTSEGACFYRVTTRTP